jgi:hypothetical protein
MIKKPFFCSARTTRLVSPDYLYIDHTPMPVPLALEQQVAIAAVRRACALTMTVFNKLVAGETLVKGDKSPVTGTPPCTHTRNGTPT